MLNLLFNPEKPVLPVVIEPPLATRILDWLATSTTLDRLFRCCNGKRKLDKGTHRLEAKFASPDTQFLPDGWLFLSAGRHRAQENAL